MIKEIQEYISKEKETTEKPSKQTLYYLDRFNRIEKFPRKLNWNWGAALGTFGWMLYRRMYWEAIFALVSIFLLEEVHSYFTGGSLGNSGYAVFGCLGFQANYFYYAHVKRQLKKKKSRGGVDLISPAILVCLGVVLLTLANYNDMW